MICFRQIGSYRAECLSEKMINTKLSVWNYLEAFSKPEVQNQKEVKWA